MLPSRSNIALGGFSEIKVHFIALSALKYFFYQDEDWRYLYTDAFKRKSKEKLTPKNTNIGRILY